VSEQQTAPGPDEIALSAPAAGQVCTSREHRRAGRPAQVIVTLGPMGAPDRHREALWLEAWGKPCPMCAPCWEATRQVAQAHRPGLVITDTRTPAGPRGPAP
jgi:hypothetical protein